MRFLLALLLGVLRTVDMVLMVGRGNGHQPHLLDMMAWCRPIISPGRYIAFPFYLLLNLSSDTALRQIFHRFLRQQTPGCCEYPLLVETSTYG
jgi:hypothetical protein